MGTLWGKDTNATTFVMMILVFPLFIIDRPYRINLLSGLMCISFLVTAIQVKMWQFLA